MKKVLSMLGLIAILGMAAPANAAPPPHAGGPHGSGKVMAGHGVSHHRPPHHGGNWGAPPPPPRAHYHHHGGVRVGGVLARRSYWGYPYGYDYRLGWYDDYYLPRPYYGSGMYINFGIPIRF